MEEDLVFDFDTFVREQLGLYMGEEARQRSICKYFLKGSCSRGITCPFKHTKGDKAVVCKHWLRGLCKKGESCEFLHEYNLKKMPECWFFSKYGECSNNECMYLHIDPNSKVKECAWYNRGFCKHGPSCRHKHVRKVACPMYLTGFCPMGPDCQFGHPKNEIPIERTEEDRSNQKQSLDSVTCFKCGQKGHYANRCPG